MLEDERSRLLSRRLCLPAAERVTINTKRSERSVPSAYRSSRRLVPSERKLTLLARTGAQVAWTEWVLQGDQTIDSSELPKLSCRVSDLWVGVSQDDAGAEDEGGR